MPEMSGLDVLRAARTEERLADVRFIVLSAMYMTKNERAGARTQGGGRRAQGGDDAARADLRAAPRGQAGACRGARCTTATAAAATSRPIGGVQR